jgi:hypothetical protein
MYLNHEGFAALAKRIYSTVRRPRPKSPAGGSIQDARSIDCEVAAITFQIECQNKAGASLSRQGRVLTGWTVGPRIFSCRQHSMSKVRAAKLWRGDSFQSNRHLAKVIDIEIHMQGGGQDRMRKILAVEMAPCFSITCGGGSDSVMCNVDLLLVPTR